MLHAAWTGCSLGGVEVLPESYRASGLECPVVLAKDQGGLVLSLLRA